MVRKTIRIYKFHDVDLFYLAEHYSFNFQKAIYCALREYLKKETCAIALPQKLESPISIPKKSICRTLILHEEQDRDLLEFLQKLPRGFMNGIVKNILRAYLCRPFMEPWADVYNQMFLDGKRVIQAAEYQKKRKNPVNNKQTKPDIIVSNDEKLTFSEKQNETEPVVFPSKRATEPVKEFAGAREPFKQKDLDYSKIKDISYPVEATDKVEMPVFSDMSEEDLLTKAFSSFFD